MAAPPTIQGSARATVVRRSQRKSECDDRVALPLEKPSEDVQNVRVGTEAGEAQDRPRYESPGRHQPDREERRAEPSSEGEPEKQRPEEELQHHESSHGCSRDPGPVAVAPEQRGADQQKRADRADRHRVCERCGEQRDPVAAVILDADDSQGERDRCDRESANRVAEALNGSRANGTIASAAGAG